MLKRCKDMKLKRKMYSKNIEIIQNV